MTQSAEKHPDWLAGVLHDLSKDGFTIVENIIDSTFLDETRRRMYAVQKSIETDIGLDRIKRAGEIGVLRLMMCYDDWFFRFLELPQILAVIDATISPTAIMHLQNGFILPPVNRSPFDEKVFQQKFHMDFPRVMNGYMASINCMVTISDFTKDSGGTLVVPGTHQKMQKPDLQRAPEQAIAVECPAGSLVVFDSTLWHAAGDNLTQNDRLAINHQFTRSFFKPQLDYVRALGDRAILNLPARSQQLLGYYTRVPTSLDEYYVAPEDRLYRSGQG